MTRSRRSVWCALMRRTGISIRTRSASWASPRAQNFPRLRRCFSTISIRRTTIRAIRWRASARGRILSASSIPVLRPSRAAVLRRRFPQHAARFHRGRWLGRPGSRAVWALDYFNAMLAMSIPNIEIHLYAQGKHPGDKLEDGSSMSGGLTDRNNIPYGTWQYRMIDWMKDLGILQKPGIETKAAKDITAYLAQPLRAVADEEGLVSAGVADRDAAGAVVRCLRRRRQVGQAILSPKSTSRCHSKPCISAINRKPLVSSGYTVLRGSRTNDAGNTRGHETQRK